MLDAISSIVLVFLSSCTLFAWAISSLVENIIHRDRAQISSVSAGSTVPKLGSGSGASPPTYSGRLSRVREDEQESLRFRGLDTTHLPC